MSAPNHSRKWIGRALAGLTGLLVATAISWLAYTVAREMQILQSARSDNAQWALAQTEVEFLNLSNAVAQFVETPSSIRRSFDIFYSRIQTIEIAAAYEALRADPVFQTNLADTRAFLDAAVPLFDLPDESFLAEKSALQAIVDETRPNVRQLSNSGLSIFAQKADIQRSAVLQTLGQLAAALGFVIGVLGFTAAYLNKLNAMNLSREQKQKEIATRMNTVIETSLDGVIVSDDQGKVVEYSPAAETIFGYTAAEAIGQDLANLIIVDKRSPPNDTGIQRILEGGTHNIVGSGRVQMQAMRKDRSLFPVELSIQAAQADNRKIYIAFLRDVSAAVAAEQELVKARDAALAGEKLKTDFLATMSHEIRTPLNGLLGNLSLLADTERDKRQDRYITNMETSGRLLMSHISDVLDITRYDAGMLAVDIVKMNISILLQDIIDNQSAMAESSSTTLSWAWQGPHREWVMSDPDRVQLILINLIGNAVKFTRGGHVTVVAEILDPADPNSPLQFCITDTGPGIPPELTQRIFDDFVTGNANFDREVGGTGLGLSIAKRFVSALGGTINFESTLGQGSTFKVVLPMPPAAEQMAPTTQPPRTLDVSPLTILIVEDNEINRIVAREMLEAAGHKVSEAHDGQDGVTQANETRFDVILMDISMPVLDGRAATKMITSGNGLSANTPIVALTAHASPEDQARFADAGMVTTLTKPLSRRSLQLVLSTIRSSTPTTQAVLSPSRVQDVTQSPVYTKLKTRFVAELDAFRIDLQDGNITLSEISDRAHHAAGSAATFQVEQVADPLRDLAVAARAADDIKIDAACAAFNTAWHRERSSFVDVAALHS